MWRPSPRGWRRRPARAAAPAAQRDGAGPAVAVLGDQRDGDRSDLHPRAGRARVRGARRRGRAVARRSGGARRGSLRAAHRLPARPPVEVRGAPRGVRSRSSRPSGAATPRARERCARSPASRPGGSRTTPLPRDPRARARAAVDRMAGRAPAPRAGGDRSRAPGAGATRCSSTSTCSGSPARSGSTPRRHTHGVELFGDLPFMVDGDSADVWARQHQFRLDVSVGVPPDAFSATGQDWGMPLYRGTSWRPEDFRWLRERARRSADLFDGYRVDHLVGFYRTYGRLKNGGEGVLHAGRRAVAGRARRAPARALPRRRRRDHRRGSRHRPRLRARVARPPRRAGLPRAAVGAALAHRRPAVPRSGGVPAPLGRHVGHARHRAARRLVGGRAGRGARQVSEVPLIQQIAGAGTDLGARAVRRHGPRRAARGAVRVGIRPARCCRCRMSSAGAIASTSRRPSATTTGPSACRGRSIGWMEYPKRARGEISCGPGLSVTGGQG